jgi:hypothetical protein
MGAASLLLQAIAVLDILSFPSNACLVAHKCTHLQAWERTCLGSKGLAIVLEPAEALLEPFSEVWCHITCINNMIGEYLDRLYCAVGGMDPVVFALRVGVVGSPIHVQAEKSLLPGLHNHVCATGRIDFGRVQQNTPLVRSFSVFNTSSFKIDIAFHVRVFEKDPSKRLCSVSLQSQANGKIAVLLWYAPNNAVSHSRFRSLKL